MPATVCSFIFLTILIVTFVLSKGRLFKKGTSQETCHIFILRYIPGVRNKILQFSVCQILVFIIFFAMTEILYCILIYIKIITY